MKDNEIVERFIDKLVEKGIKAKSTLSDLKAESEAPDTFLTPIRRAIIEIQAAGGQDEEHLKVAKESAAACLYHLVNRLNEAKTRLRATDGLELAGLLKEVIDEIVLPVHKAAVERATDRSARFGGIRPGPR